MFEFFEEYDKEIYKEIIDEVEFNMWNDRCVSIIQSEVEKIIKKLFKESEIAITNVGADGIVYREYNPTLHRLFRNDEFKKYLHENKILSSEEIDNYQNFKFRNYKEHGPKYNEVLCINEKTKEDSLKFLFKLCYQVYLYKFQKQPNAYWDEMYFKKLLEKPTKEVVVVEKPVEKIVEVEKEKIVERVVDNTELEKVKNEQEDLKKQISQLKSAPSNFNNVNYALLERLEIGNKCLQNKDFANARISFNNCRNLDITCYEAYLGLILCDYAVSSQEELIEKIYSNNTLGENENYQMILRFCSKDDVNKTKLLSNKINERKNEEKIRRELVSEKFYQEALLKLKTQDYQSAYKILQMILEYKDARKLFNKIIASLKKKYKNNLYLYVKEIKALISFTNDQKLINSLKSIIELNKKFDVDCVIHDGSQYFMRREVTKETVVVVTGKTIRRGCFGGDLIPWPKVGKIVLNNDLESIGSCAFKNCRNLKSIVIPNSVTSIGESAFYGCHGLESIAISNSVTSIGDYAFCGCDSLESIVIPNSVTSIGMYAFFNCGSLKSIVIPNSVTSIGDYAFQVCGSLESIVIPNSVTSISKGAFYICGSLKSIVIPNSVTSIGDCTFVECASLETIVIPDSVTSIGFCMFENCRNLKSIVIPNGVTSIGEYAFSGCGSLKSIVIPNSVTSISKGAFYGWSENQTIYFCVSGPDEIENKGCELNCRARIVWGYQGKQ